MSLKNLLKNMSCLALFLNNLDSVHPSSFPSPSFSPSFSLCLKTCGLAVKLRRLDVNLPGERGGCLRVSPSSSFVLLSRRSKSLLLVGLGLLKESREQPMLHSLQILPEKYKTWLV